MKRGKTILRVVIVLACWYAFVWFSQSCAPNHIRWRAIQARVLANAKQLERKTLTQDQLVNAVAGFKLKWDMTEFKPEIAFQSDSNWTVRLEPSQTEPYNVPLWWRIAFLDFSKAHFRTVEVGANEDARQLGSW
jgi:hypothetical protein